jgi:hypothetical protein
VCGTGRHHRERGDTRQLYRGGNSLRVTTSFVLIGRSRCPCSIRERSLFDTYREFAVDEQEAHLMLAPGLPGCRREESV